MFICHIFIICASSRLSRCVLILLSQKSNLLSSKNIYENHIIKKQNIHTYTHNDDKF